MTVVVADSNEAAKAPKIVRALQKEFNVIIDPLACGDWLFIGSEEHRPLLIERKTPTDLVGSMKNGRLVRQLKGLKDFEDKGDICLLIEGWMGTIQRFTRFDATSVSRFIESIALVWKVPIIPSPNQKWTISWFKSKAKAMGKPKEKKLYALRPSARKVLDVGDQARYVLEGIPGIGPKRATVLLRKFGSIKNITNASRDELKKAVGNKTADRIIEVIEWLCPDI